MGLARRTIRGVAWAYTVFFSARFATLITTAILARILFAEDFGLIGFSLLFLNFVEATRDFGVKDALIYNDEKIEETTVTAFWLNVAIGLLQYSLAFAVAPLAKNFIADDRIVLMIRLMSLTFIINSLGNTHDGLLQKDLAFRRRYIPNLYSSIIKGIISIVLAVSGAGVWSLVAGHVIGSVIRTIVIWNLMPWRPSFHFYKDRARALWNYGVYILLFNVLVVGLEQADQLFIGTLLGEEQLGYYTIAARVPEMVIANFSVVLTTVLFPTYAKMKDNIAMLTQGFMMTTRYTSFITIPAGFGLAAVAPELVRVVFGNDWEPAIIILRVLAFLGVAGALPWSVGDVFKAVGRPDLSTKLLVVEALITFPLIWILAVQTREAVMASFANLIAISIAAVMRFALVSRFLKIPAATLARIFVSPFIAGGAMFAAVTLWREVASSLPALIILSVSIIIGGIIYPAIMFLLEKDELMQAREFLMDTVRKRKEKDDDLVIEEAPA